MTTPDHTLTVAERETLSATLTNWIAAVVVELETIITDRLAAVEAVRDHYAILAGIPVHAADVADRLDAALGSNADD